MTVSSITGMQRRKDEKKKAQCARAAPRTRSMAEAMVWAAPESIMPSPRMVAMAMRMPRLALVRPNSSATRAGAALARNLVLAFSVHSPLTTFAVACAARFSAGVIMATQNAPMMRARRACIRRPRMPTMTTAIPAARMSRGFMGTGCGG